MTAKGVKMLKNLPWTLTWKLIPKSLQVVWKGGRNLAAAIIGLGTFFVILPFNHLVNQHNDASAPIFNFFILTIVIVSAVSLVIALYVSFLSALLTGIFKKHLPAYRNYRAVILWATFFGCGLCTFTVTLQSNFLDHGLREALSMIVAVYGSWVAEKLVDWIDKESGLWPPAEPEKKIEMDAWLSFEFRKLRARDLSRYQIDRELLDAGFKPEQLEELWSPGKPQRKPKVKIDYRNWSRVLLGTVIPALVLTLIGSLVWWVI